MSNVAEKLSSYVPRLVLDRLARGGPIRDAEIIRGHAAVLLSDMEGFAALVEHFSEAGRAGLEELTLALDAYFADLVDIVYQYGGDVLSIAGDGFLCVWPAASAGDLPEMTLCAAQAGLEIQSRLAQRVIGGERKVAMRVGVGAGELITAFVGGLDGKWELVTTGPALEQVTNAEKVAAAGDVALSLRAWSLVEQRCVGRPLAGGYFVATGLRDKFVASPSAPRVASGSVERMLRPFVPLAVPDDPRTHGMRWLAEIRPVTVVQAELGHFADGSEDSLRRMHRSVRTLQEVMRRYEGAVHVATDDKGITLVTVFGQPPMAHENDAERAVRAAYALRDALAEFGVRRGIGIATGRALCGSFGSRVRRDYTIRGKVINLAARLMQAASGEVLCDQATRQAVRGRIDFQTLPPIMVKGKEQAVTVHRVVGMRAVAAGGDAPIIGRTRERRFLRDRLRALAAGNGGGVLVEAEAGLGKTRLVLDLARNARKAEIGVLTGAADAIESSTAYYAWRPVFASIIGLTADTSPLDAVERVRAFVAGSQEMERLLPLLRAVLPIQIPDTDLTREMVGEVRGDNTNELLVRMLQKRADAGPALLLLEDVHWLDSSSWTLLLQVLRSVKPVLTVITHRPLEDSAPVEYGRLVQLPDVRSLALEALPPEDTLALVQQRLGVRDVPLSLVTFVQDRVAGHPFFCEELVQSMLEAGAITVVGDTCEVGELGDLDLPTTVEGVILSRLDRLTQGAQLCLKVASVVGRTFRVRTVREVYPVEDERGDVADHLAALARLDLIVPYVTDPEPAYVFKHVITRDVAYDLMTLSQRQPLHRAVAEWYERNHAADLTPYHALLAHHWLRGAEPRRAIDHIEQAAQQALRGGAFSDALQFFSRAIALHDEGRVDADRIRRALWEKGVGTAHYFLGDLERSRHHVAEAVALLDRRVPASRGEIARSLLLATLRQASHALFPHRYHGRRAAEKATLSQAVDCYKILGQIYYLDGEPAPPIFYFTLRGLNVGEEAGPSPELARILSNIGTLTSLLGATRWADWYTTRAIRMAEEEGHHGAAAYVWNIAALKHAQLGQWAAARAANQKALEVIGELGDNNLEAEVWVVRSTLQICEGDFRSAETAWPRARALARANGNDQILCWSLLDEVDTRLGQDRTADAAEVLEEALAIPTATTDGGTTIDKQRAVAVTRQRQGRHAEAIEAADVVIGMVALQPPVGYHWVEFCASAVEVYLDVLDDDCDYARDNREALIRKAERGVALLKRHSRRFHNVRPRVPLLRGRLHWIQGRRRRARRDLQQARRLARDMEMPFEQARAAFELARRGLDATHLENARRTFELLGAQHYLALANGKDAVTPMSPDRTRLDERPA